MVNIKQYSLHALVALTFIGSGCQTTNPNKINTNVYTNTKQMQQNTKSANTTTNNLNNSNNNKSEKNLSVKNFDNKENEQSRIVDKSVGKTQTPHTTMEDKKNKGDENSEKEMYGEISGLIMSESMTRIGNDFYEYFTSNWEYPKGIEQKTLVIKENAHPLWGSIIKIYIDMNEDQTLWQSVLKPRSTEIEENAKQAVEIVKQALIMQQTQDSDKLLEKDVNPIGI